MKNCLKYGSFLLLAALSFIVAVYSTGLSHHSNFSPRSSKGELKNIVGDGWITEKSVIEVRGLNSRGNWLELKFDSWYPEGVHKPTLEAYVCGVLASKFESNVGGTQKIYLKGNCEPKLITFKIPNPILLPGDTREFGAKVAYFSFNSPLKVPLVDFNRILLVFIGILLLVLFAGRVWSKNKSIASLSLLLFAFYVTSFSTISDETLVLFCLFIISLLLGFYLDKKSMISSLPPVVNKSINYELLAVCLFFIALALRLDNIIFGLPNNYHPDEVPKYNAIMRMRQYGDLNPRYFLHPSLLLYMTYGMNQLLRFFGLFDGAWDSSLVLSGRVGSAIAGSISVWLVYFSGKKLFNSKVGLIAALFLAFSPLHVTCSRYVKEDVLLTMWALFSVACLLKACSDKNKLFLLLSGVFAGCAAGTKYTGILCSVIVFSAPFLWGFSETKDKETGILDIFKFDSKVIFWTLAALILIPIAFVVCTPYSVLDYSTFIKDFNHERAHMNKGHTILISAWSQWWMYHWSRSIVPGLTIVTSVLSAIGIGALLWKRKTYAWFLVGLVLLFYLPSEWVKAKPAPQPERYIVPCLPFLSIAAAYCISLVSNKNKKIALIILLLSFSLTAKRTVSLNKDIAYDTREQLEDWMRGNLKSKSTVFIDWKPYSVRFWQEEFELVYLPRSKIIPSLDVGELRKSNVDYLVLSSLFYDRYFSQPGVNPALREQIRQVFRAFPTVVEFESKHGTYGFHNPKLSLIDLRDVS